MLTASRARLVGTTTLRRPLARIQSTLASPSAAMAKPSFAARAIQWYAGKLESHPLLTKGITGGLIAAMGDVLCQAVQAKDPQLKNLQVDWMRTLRFGAVGAFWIAPGVHYWYGALATRLLPGQCSISVAKRVAVDQFLFAPPFIASILSLLWLLEGDVTSSSNASDIPTRLSATLPDIVRANWVVWIPANFINFGLVPLPFQVLFNNALGLFWNAYLSYTSSIVELVVEEEAHNEDKRD